ncbi:FCS-Like Zinc finger 5-like [Fagus crenata]
MLLGKRPRPPMKRTTSMTGITMDPSVFEPQESSDHHHDDYNQHGIAVDSEGYSLSLPPSDQNMDMNLDTMNFVPNSNGHDHRLLAMVSPRATKSTILRRNSGDFIETSHFLHTCGLCQRRLPPGRDIYMYRGDTAFCSLECREQQMKQDERKEKYTVVTKKEDRNGHGSPSKASTKASSKSETVAAA